MKTFDQFIPTEELAAYRTDCLRRQLAWAKEHSLFYRRHLAGIDPATARLEDLPFTTASDVAEYGAEMVCLPAGDVARIVTLRTSGSSGAGKRLYFSRRDLDRTAEFFAVGMGYLCGPGDRVLVALPGRAPDGLGRLLQTGLETLGAEVLLWGGLDDMEAAAKACLDFRPHTIVSAAALLRRLALTVPTLRPRNVLLSTDYVAQSAVETIRRLWQCDVFTHYGLTETGYGCAVECPAHAGQHIRHDELILEIVEPGGTRSLPPGRWGEIVLTTLRREAMPLIRYRTGDKGRLLDAPCPCGSRLPRLDRVPGRLELLESPVSVYALDECLLACDDIRDYRAERGADGTLHVALDTDGLQGVHYARTALRRRFPDLPLRIERGDVALRPLEKRNVKKQ